MKLEKEGESCLVQFVNGLLLEKQTDSRMQRFYVNFSFFSTLLGCLAGNEINGKVIQTENLTRKSTTILITAA